MSWLKVDERIKWGQSNHPMYEYSAKLDRVVDGDTVDAFIDLGFDIWVKKRIRLYGIDAPESRTRDLEEKKRGIAAKNRLIELFNEADGHFVLKSHGIGKYGRCLGEIYINNISTSVNKQLIIEQHAEIYDE